MSATIKSAVIEMIERLHDDSSLADIMAELYFRSKVDEGLKQLDAGQGLEHSDVKERLKPWLV